MKVGFYLENKNIANVDLRQPELGNPGIGGTEFNFLTLVDNMMCRYPDNAYCIYANSISLLPVHMCKEQANDCTDAISKAVRDGCDFFVWRPTVREDAKRLIESLNEYDIRIIIWAHNTPAPEDLTAFSEADNVKRFVPVGYEQSKLIAHPGIKAKTTVINNGFDAAPYTNSQPIDKNPRLILYTGSLIPVKGFGMLARAWPKIIAQFPEAILKVMGSGQLYNRNAELGRWGVADRKFEDDEIAPYLSDENGCPHRSVEFLGVIGAKKIEMLKSAIAGVVNPSGIGENCPGSAIEFLAAGTAVVSANSHGVLDVVDHQKTGLLGAGVDALVQNVCAILGDPDHAIELGRAGPAQICEKFNYDLICSKWRQLFLEAACS